MPLSALIGALLAGVFGGVHCIAMCGGFATALAGGSKPASGRTVPLLSARALAWRQVPHNAGRVATYAILGAIAGGAGGALLAAAGWQPLQRSLYVVANLLLLGLAVAIVSKYDLFAGLQAAGGALVGRILPLARPLARSDAAGARFALGMIWGLVPCALVYGVLPIALFAGSAVEGAAVMTAFGLGTLPNLLAAGWIASRARGILDARVARCAAAALIAGFAVVGLARAMLPGALAPGVFCL